MSAKLASWCACVAVLSCLSGCFSYVLHDRGTRADFQLPIDEHKPVSTTMWSSIWGGSIPVWRPLRCIYQDGSVHYVLDEQEDRNCKQYKRVCEKGVGRTQVSLRGYSLPLAILTLGFAMPAEISVYCATAAAEPETPSCPDGPLGPQ
jgi:hypothetical protein